MRFSVLFLLSLAGCATHMAPTDARTTYLVCGSAVRLDISHDGTMAVLRELDGPTSTLQRVPSDSGIRYAGEGVSVMRTADVYVYTDRTGDTVTCDPLPR